MNMEQDLQAELIKLKHAMNGFLENQSFLIKINCIIFIKDYQELLQKDMIIIGKQL